MNFEWFLHVFPFLASLGLPSPNTVMHQPNIEQYITAIYSVILTKYFLTRLYNNTVSSTNVRTVKFSRIFVYVDLQRHSASGSTQKRLSQASYKKKNSEKGKVQSDGARAGSPARGNGP